MPTTPNPTTSPATQPIEPALPSVFDLGRRKYALEKRADDLDDRLTSLPKNAEQQSRDVSARIEQLRDEYSAIEQLIYARRAETLQDAVVQAAMLFTDLHIMGENEIAFPPSAVKRTYEELEKFTATLGGILHVMLATTGLSLDEIAPGQFDGSVLRRLINGPEAL